MLNSSTTITRSENPIKWEFISPWFSPNEILSPETRGHLHCVDLSSLLLLNDLRKYVDTRILVNHLGHNRRGVRSAKEQLELVQSVGAALNSQHVAGKAFDITIPELTLKETAEAANDIGFVYVKIYETANFVHVDNRNLIILS